MTSNLFRRQREDIEAWNLDAVFLDIENDFEPQQPSDTEEDPDDAASGDGSDGFPIPGSG